MGIRQYGTSTDDKIKKESSEAREIVQKIIEYGISQKQILYIIYDLALNIDNNDHMRRITSIIKDISEDSVDNLNKSPLTIDLK